MAPLRLAALALASLSPLLTPSASTSARTDDLLPVPSRASTPDFALKDVHGKLVSLSGLKGHVVLLDFWATTCGGCKVELPWYVEFDSKYRAKGLSVIGLDMYGETAEVIKPFMAKWKMKYPVAIGTDALGERFSVKEMPLTLLIDRQGKIAVSHAGIVDKVAFENDILKLLHE